MKRRDHHGRIWALGESPLVVGSGRPLSHGRQGRARDCSPDVATFPVYIALWLIEDDPGLFVRLAIPRN